MGRVSGPAGDLPSEPGPLQALERWGATFLRLGHRQLLMGPLSPASLFPASILPTAKALGF